MNAVDYLMNNQTAAGDTVLLTPIGEHSYGELRQASDAVADFLIRVRRAEGRSGSASFR